MSIRDWPQVEQDRYDGICTECRERRAEPGFDLCGPCSDEERADVAFHALHEGGRL